jgi:hypothetical protein
MASPTVETMDLLKVVLMASRTEKLLVSWMEKLLSEEMLDMEWVEGKIGHRCRL